MASMIVRKKQRPVSSETLHIYAKLMNGRMMFQRLNRVGQCERNPFVINVCQQFIDRVRYPMPPYKL